VQLASIATVIGTVIAIAGLAYSYGRRRERRGNIHKEIREEHGEMREAHHLLHQDFDKLFEQFEEINGLSTYKVCPVCNEVEEE
jgi:hypothetical protein